MLDHRVYMTRTTFTTITNMLYDNSAYHVTDTYHYTVRYLRQIDTNQ